MAEDQKTHFRDELAALTAIDGISGHEHAVAEHLRELMTPLVDRVEMDSMGSLYAIREGGDGPHLMIGVHSDEIGGIVSDIEPDGFVRFQIVGGTAEMMLVGRKVRVAGHLGVVGVRPGHLATAEQRKTAPNVND